jgi:pimeloyl-ACP methyl ester carboxylesterase
VVRDSLALVYALGYRCVAAVVGHDFGSPVAAYCSLVRPDFDRAGPRGWPGSFSRSEVDRLEIRRHDDFEGRDGGAGTIDFGALFKKVEDLGYEGHHTNGWGTLDAMVEGREYMVARAKEAGVDVEAH